MASMRLPPRGDDGDLASREEAVPQQAQEDGEDE
jgi:hypothetical protein